MFMRDLISSSVDSLQSLRWDRRRLPDIGLLAVVLILTAFGLLMNYSTTFDWSAQQSGSPLALFGNQLVYTMVGLVAFAVLLRLDYARLFPLALPLMVVSLVLLLFVRVFGDTLFGATRTLSDGSVQPSEIAKVATVLYAAVWLSSRHDQLHSIRLGLVPFGVIVGFVFGLVAIQPDLSTAGIIAISGAAMFFLAGAKFRQIALIGLIGIPIAMALVAVFPHAGDRFEMYVRTLANPPPLDTHLGQVRAAIIDGGLFGQGIGAGYRKFGVLPLPFSDSIYPAIAEEWGVVGVTFTLGLFAAFLVLGLRVARRADTRFGAYLAIGITTWVTLQMLINTTGMLGLLPPMGVPVPFLSKGGSSAISVLIACGILLSVSRGSAAKAELLGGTIALGGRKQARANSSFGRGNRGSRAAGADRAARPDEDDDQPPLVGGDAAKSPRSRQRFASDQPFIGGGLARKGRRTNGVVRRRGRGYGTRPGDARRR